MYDDLFYKTPFYDEENDTSKSQKHSDETIIEKNSYIFSGTYEEAPNR